MLANEHDADDTWLHLTLDSSPKVILQAAVWAHGAQNWEANLLYNQLFQGGKSSRAQTAKSLLGGKAEPPLTFQQHRPVCQTCVWADDRSAPSAFPVSQYIQETLQWFYRDGNSKHRPLKHPVRAGLCFWNQYLAARPVLTAWAEAVNRACVVTSFTGGNLKLGTDGEKIGGKPVRV